VSIGRALACTALAAASAAGAQSFPARPMRLVVPFGPGGVGDITARAVAQRMGDAMGQQVIIDNRPSAGGIVASELVAKAEPDGHTMLLMNNTNAVSATLFRKLPYDTVRDFATVSTIGAFSIVVLVSPETPSKTLREVIAAARANPARFNLGSIQIGSTQHLSAELFKAMAGLEAVTVPFNNTAGVLTALRGGNVQVAFEFLPAVIGQIRAGTLRALAVSPPKRFAVLPEVPTVAEAGIPGYEVTSWNGIAVPAKTPRPVVDRLNREIAAAIASPDVTKRFQDLSVDPNPSTPEGMHRLLVDEIGKWKSVIEKAKIERQ
jgi:tripartite-type tricarboxylate transporter receptor subunit TctC